MTQVMTKPSGSPRERIMQVAADLFYQQGFRATGVNEVIEKSGVAKATFYKHFPSKEELGRAYIESMRIADLQFLEDWVARASTPRERLMAVIGSIGPWLRETNFRGCPFMNMVAEIPDPDSPLRKPGTGFYGGVRETVRTLAGELIASDPDRYRHLDADALTDEYMPLFAGAIGLGEIYHELWPVEHALKAARRLIGES